MKKVTVVTFVPIDRYNDVKSVNSLLRFLASKGGEFRTCPVEFAPFDQNAASEGLVMIDDSTDTLWVSRSLTITEEGWARIGYRDPLTRPRRSLLRRFIDWIHT